MKISLVVSLVIGLIVAGCGKSNRIPDFETQSTRALIVTNAHEKEIKFNSVSKGNATSKLLTAEFSFQPESSGWLSMGSETFVGSTTCERQKIVKNEWVTLNSDNLLGTTVLIEDNNSWKTEAKVGTKYIWKTTLTSNEGCTPTIFGLVYDFQVKFSK